MEFKDKLKSLRKEKGLSQQALADAIFISRSAVAKWENGLGLPSEESLNALLSFFGVPKEYFATEQPEAVLIEKNRLIRRLASSLAVCMVIIFSLLVLFVISIPIVNDLTAAQIKDRLEQLPLPENSQRIDALSCAGKMVGSGNGMQYLGAILVQSDLSLQELENHYAQYRANRWDCIIAEYHGGDFDFIDTGRLSFSTKLDPTENYYVVYSWGNGLDFFVDWDLRGH